MKTKKELRNEILRKRDALTLEERKEKSREITKLVVSHKSFQEADTILLFASFKSEVDTTEIFKIGLKEGKDIFYPKVIGREMEFFSVKSETDFKEGCWGIREPEANEEKRFMPKGNEKICVIMPGAVFDVEGNRIGYGGGYYDKFLSQLERVMKGEGDTIDGALCKLAIAFQCQVISVGQMLSEDYDIKPDYLVTEQQVYSCNH